MKLNPDCIRDVMLVLEDELSVCVQECEPHGEIFRFQPMRMETLTLRLSKLNGYSKPDIVYSVLQLVENKYIVMDGVPPACGRNNQILLNNILYITPDGHKFVSSIQDKDRWNGKIKPVLDKIGSVSLYIIEAVSKGITTAAIDRLLVAQDNT